MLSNRICWSITNTLFGGSAEAHFSTIYLAQAEQGLRHVVRTKHVGVRRATQVGVQVPLVRPGAICFQSLMLSAAHDIIKM